MVHSEIACLAKILDSTVLFNTFRLVVRYLLCNFHYVKSSLLEIPNMAQDLAFIIHVDVHRFLLK
jgi:hypothetical protein